MGDENLNEGQDDSQSGTGQLAEGQAQGNANESDSSNFQMPDKLAGKSVEEIGKLYVDLETHLGERDKTPAELGEIRNQLTELREAILSKDKPPEDVAAANTRNYLKSIGIPTTEDLEKAKEEGRKGYELDRINSDLVKKYDGKDGRPAFNSQEIGTYAIQNGIQNLPPETVYKLRYEKELDDWKAQQVLKGNRAPAVPGQGKGAQEPTPPDTSKMKPDEVEAAARENALKRIRAQESV